MENAKQMEDPEVQIAYYNVEKQLREYLENRGDKGANAVFKILMDGGSYLRNVHNVRKQSEVVYRVFAGLATHARTLEEEAGCLSTQSNISIANALSKFVQASIDLESQLCRFTVERDADRQESERVDLPKIFGGIPQGE